MNSKKSFSWSFQECEKIANDINSLKLTIVSLQNEIKKFKLDIISNEIHTNVLFANFENMISKFGDGQVRESNLIIFGLPEKPSEIIIDERS